MINVFKGLFGYESAAFRIPAEVDTTAANFSDYVVGKWVKMNPSTGKYELAVAADAGNPLVFQLFDSSDVPASQMSEVLGVVVGHYFAETDQFEAGTYTPGTLLTLSDNGTLTAAVAGNVAVAVCTRGIVDGKIQYMTLPNRPTAP